MQLSLHQKTLLLLASNAKHSNMDLTFINHALKNQNFNSADDIIWDNDGGVIPHTALNAKTATDELITEILNINDHLQFLYRRWSKDQSYFIKVSQKLEKIINCTSTEQIYQTLTNK